MRRCITKRELAQISDKVTTGFQSGSSLVESTMLTNAVTRIKRTANKKGMCLSRVVSKKGNTPSIKTIKESSRSIKMTW